MHTRSLASKIVCLTLATVILSGCNAFRRLAEVGEDPAIAPVSSPTQREDFVRVSLPMPPPVTADRRPSSLWRPGARAFFQDQRANQIGDILTVLVSVADDATVNGTTTRTRTNSEDLAITDLLGFETQTAGWLPEVAGVLDPAITIDGGTNNTNGGTVTRTDEINFRVAAVVTQVLPNGNMVIYGKQEIRVGAEVRELNVAGVIRPEDISTTNTIAYDQIAEARLAYGGRGIISDSQRPRWGTEVMDVLLPF